MGRLPFFFFKMLSTNLTGADLGGVNLKDAILCNITMPEDSVIYNGSWLIAKLQRLSFKAAIWRRENLKFHSQKITLKCYSFSIFCVVITTWSIELIISFLIGLTSQHHSWTLHEHPWLISYSTSKQSYPFYNAVINRSALSLRNTKCRPFEKCNCQNWLPEWSTVR